MNAMKRYLAGLLLIALLCGLLAGCGGEEKTLSTQKQDATVMASASEENEAPTERETKPEVTIAETVVYDSEEIKITAVTLEESWLGQNIKLLVENNSGHNIALSGSDMVVNGVVMYGYLHIEVAAGMKAYGMLELYEDSLTTASIEQIAFVAAKDAYIYDTDSYETLTATPFEIVTSLGQDYVQSVDESGEVLFESNGITVTAKVITEEFYGKTILLFVKNTTDKDVIVEAQNISVNGFTVDAWLYDRIYAGTVRFCNLDLYASGLEESGITEIEDVTFAIALIDPNSYNTIAKSEKLQVYVG